jgi:DNA-binding HxlR family transcriptional regulator
MEMSDAICPRYEQATRLIAKKWTPLLIKILLDGPRRFGAFRPLVPQLSDRMLSERLKELEEAGLVVRHVQDSPPVCVTYELTDMGRDLAPVVEAIEGWAHRWLTPTEERQPAAVGAAVEDR